MQDSSTLTGFEASTSSADVTFPSPGFSPQKRRFEEVYSSSSDQEDESLKEAELCLNGTEKATSLVVDGDVWPLVQEELKYPSGHARSGQAWSVVERATVRLALARKILGKRAGTTLESRVENFLTSRPGWEIGKKSVKMFVAQIYKRK